MTTQEAVAQIEGDVRELIRRSGIDPARDHVEVRQLVVEAVQEYDERSLHGGMPVLGDPGDAVRSILSGVAGYGPLQQYLDDPAVEEIWINEPSRVFVARGGTAELTSTILTAEDVRDLVERMLKSSGRRVDLSSPFVDATLPDGSRLHVVIPDISRKHWQVNIRKFVVKAEHLEDLVRLGTLTKQAATFLEAAVASGLNILVAGGTQAGKTTMLNCLSAAIPPRDRVVTCEEVFELRIPLRDVAAMQCRQPSLEGTGEVPLRRLVKEALRMRPSRIIVHVYDIPPRAYSPDHARASHPSTTTPSHRHDSRLQGGEPRAGRPPLTRPATGSHRAVCGGTSLRRDRVDRGRRRVRVTSALPVVAAARRGSRPHRGR
jgi:pilus assembly protein CpaF